MTAQTLTTGQCATLACLLEAAPPKVGNVHRGADFDDLTFLDFATAAVLIWPAMEAAVETGVGAAVLAAVKATRTRIQTNVNLGICLLLAPLAAVPRGEGLRTGVAKVLKTLTPQDSADVYRAINLARPGGLGVAPAMDVSAPPPADLVAAMDDARERDLVARQYVTDFSLVLEQIAPRLGELCGGGAPIEDAVVRVQIELLAEFGDSLIERKCGPEINQETRERAAYALDAADSDEEVYLDRLADLDFWLRSDGRKRNPGSTADLIAAGLFVGLRDERLAPPSA